MDYDNLPVVLQVQFTRKEWDWMPDDQKAGVLDQETTPDYEEELSDAG